MPTNEELNYLETLIGKAKTSNVDRSVKTIDTSSTEALLQSANKLSNSGVLSSQSYGLDLEEYKNVATPRPELGIDYLNKQRAANQSGVEQAINMTKRIIGSEVIGGTLESAGALAEILPAVFSEIQGQDADFSNFLTEWGGAIRETVDKAAPIYRANPDKGIDVGDSGWWYENIPSVASSLSMLIPIWGTEKALGTLVAKSATLGKAAGRLSDTAKYWCSYATS
jgi:hypothetical protein